MSQLAMSCPSPNLLSPHSMTRLGRTFIEIPGFPCPFVILHIDRKRGIFVMPVRGTWNTGLWTMGYLHPNAQFKVVTDPKRILEYQRKCK